MSERPILFNDAMVRAVLAGTKTQTRRPIKSLVGQPACNVRYHDERWEQYGAGGVWLTLACPFGEPGDYLWVRECWRPCYSSGLLNWHVLYRADGAGIHREEREADLKYMRSGDRWQPSIHMPRWASRIMRPVKRVWIEQVQDISEEGARAEGFERREHFIRAWDSIYAAKGYGFDDNQQVWGCEFERSPT